LPSPDPRVPDDALLELRIETPRGSFVKRNFVGGALRLGFVSPLPCPFDYGHVAGFNSGDGLGQDALWLGPRARLGDVVRGRLAAVVRFVDDGIDDPKWVLTRDGDLDDRDADRVLRFFRLYARVWRLLSRDARCLGLVTRDGEGGR